MTDRKRPSVGFWATVVLVALLVGYFIAIEAYGPWQPIRGARQAAQDISIKQPRYLIYGELAPFESEAGTVLWKRYGVRVERVAGCEVSDALIRRCDAYNRAISAQFGFTGSRDIFLSTVDELIMNQPDKQPSP